MALVTITTEDVQARFPEGTGDATQIKTLAADAETILLAKYPLLPQWLATGRVSEDTVKLLLIRAVLRVLRYGAANAGPYESESDADYSYKLNPTVASADLWWPESELALLPAKQAAKNLRAGTIPLVVPGLYQGRR